MQTYRIRDPDTFRHKISDLLAKRTACALGDAGAINMEKGIYNFSIQEATKKNIIRKWENPHFVQLYMDRLRSVYMNLSNPTLVERLTRGEVLPQDVSFMTHQDFCPEKWDALIQQKQKRDASKFVTNVQASTDVYQCRRCKSRRCVFSEQQIRSADESMTIFVTCLDCGKQWRC
jgi:DNA-directed RNA polymerase subunit M/transcription elongation factor TFIIS